MRELVVAVVCMLPMTAWAWTNLDPRYVNLSPDTRETLAVLLAGGRGHGGPRGGGGPAISSSGGGVSTPGTFGADPATRGEPSGVIYVQQSVPTPPQPVQMQMQRVQTVPAVQQFQLVPVQPVVQPQPVQWEGSTTVSVPVTLRLGLGQAVVGAPCPSITP